MCKARDSLSITSTWAFLCPRITNSCPRGAEISNFCPQGAEIITDLDHSSRQHHHHRKFLRSGNHGAASYYFLYSQLSNIGLVLAAELRHPPHSASPPNLPKHRPRPYSHSSCLLSGSCHPSAGPGLPVPPATRFYPASFCVRYVLHSPCWGTSILTELSCFREDDFAGRAYRRAVQQAARPPDCGHKHRRGQQGRDHQHQRGQHGRGYGA